MSLLVKIECEFMVDDVSGYRPRERGGESANAWSSIHAVYVGLEKRRLFFFSKARAHRAPLPLTYKVGAPSSTSEKKGA